MIVRIALLIILGLIVILAFRYASQWQEIEPKAEPITPYAYYGAYIPNGQRYISQVVNFESHTKKGVAIVHWYQGWGVTDGTQYFQTAWMDNIRNHGSIPMITWEPWDYTKGLNQPAYSLKSIYSGIYDAYITKWAQDSKAWGKPYFLRFAHEMNASSYPWSESTNGNQPGDYVLAWKHVRDIFTANGAVNVTWVWSPNIEYSGTTPLEGLYPGDAYVDWVAMDGYNGGTALDWGGWLTFPQIFGATYSHLKTLAPSKPIMIAELASAEAGGPKADWIKEAYQTMLPAYYPKIKAIVWFNENREADWRIESSATAQDAFAVSVASTYYAPNQYANLTNSPIPAPENVVIPTPTATVASSPAPADTTPPAVAITNPANGAIVSGKIKISVSASDNAGVVKVDFFIDNKLTVSDKTIPYEYYWNTRNVTSGAHTIKAAAYDAVGNSSQSQITVYK